MHPRKKYFNYLTDFQLMKNEYMIAIFAGIVLLSISYTIAPQTHHYSMMVSPFYSLIPSILALTGIILIVIPIILLTQGEKLRSSIQGGGILSSNREPSQKTENETKEQCEKIEVAEKLLDEDEKKIFSIVVENEGITQDSLHFRTGFSHSKITMVIKKLEEKDLIYRERFGKTYRIYVSDWIKK